MQEHQCHPDQARGELTLSVARREVVMVETHSEQVAQEPPAVSSLPGGLTSDLGRGLL